MAKLTRHSSFQALKAPVPSPQVVTLAERDQAHAAFEEFIQLLQQKRAVSKKRGSGDER